MIMSKDSRSLATSVAMATLHQQFRGFGGIEPLGKTVKSGSPQDCRTSASAACPTRTLVKPTDRSRPR